MPNLKLSYFDFHGGRGEVARLTLSIGQVPFEDDRIPLSTWASVREQMPFHAVPVLEVDGKSITQSNGINRYVGKLTGLYPDDPFEALLCDEVMDAVEDVLTQIVPTFRIKDEEAKREARHALADGVMSLYLARLDEKLVERGGAYFADSRLTVADLKVFVWINSLRAGVLDYIPTDLTDRIAPHLALHNAQTKALPQIAGYYETRGSA